MRLKVQDGDKERRVLPGLYGRYITEGDGPNISKKNEDVDDVRNSIVVKSSSAISTNINTIESAMDMEGSNFTSEQLLLNKSTSHYCHKKQKQNKIEQLSTEKGDNKEKREIRIPQRTLDYSAAQEDYQKSDSCLENNNDLNSIRKYQRQSSFHDQTKPLIDNNNTIPIKKQNSLQNFEKTCANLENNPNDHTQDNDITPLVNNNRNISGKKQNSPQNFEEACANPVRNQNDHTQKMNEIVEKNPSREILRQVSQQLISGIDVELINDEINNSTSVKNSSHNQTPVVNNNHNISGEKQNSLQNFEEACANFKNNQNDHIQDKDINESIESQSRENIRSTVNGGEPEDEIKENNFTFTSIKQVDSFSSHNQEILSSTTDLFSTIVRRIENEESNADFFSSFQKDDKVVNTAYLPAALVFTFLLLIVVSFSFLYITKIFSSEEEILQEEFTAETPGIPEYCLI